MSPGRALVLSCALAALVLVPASLAAGAAPGGTWVGASGLIGVPLPAERLSTVRLSLAGSTATVVAVGPTGASHDAPSAKGTCTTRYRLHGVRGGWQYFRPLPGGTVRGEGGLETAPCSTRPLWLMRLRPGGAKLKAEWATIVPGRGIERPAQFLYRAYLARG